MNTLKTFVAISLVITSITTTLKAQAPGGKGGPGMAGGMQRQMPTGRFYGKIVDEKTKKGLAYTPVQLFVSKFDSASKSMKTTLAGGQLTEENGDFNIPNLPAFGKYTLKVSAMGYKPFETAVGFDIKMSPQGVPNMAQMGAALDKDLGNIKLTSSSQQLKEVVIDGSAPSFKLDIDKKVFNVDKNTVSTGGSAQDVMKNIPSVNVDVDGNVTMRNSSPQIFVDGRPTTLTLDQIPADAIEKVELITNPSAKFDAGDGGGGIINIVMKNNRQVGYNGNLRLGTDKRGKLISGFDLNVRQGKFNFFVNGNLNQRKSIGYGETDRHNLVGSPLTNSFQVTNSVSNNYFGFGKVGMDYFIDNRNTITIAPFVQQGHMEPGDELSTRIDTVGNGHSKIYNRTSLPKRTFSTIGGQLLYKHLFTKQGHELTADANYQTNTFHGRSWYTTQYYDTNNEPYGSVTKQYQDGTGTTQYTTLQSDYVNPITENSKIEAGVRAAVRYFSNTLDNYLNGVNVPLANSNYNYSDKVYAAYATYGGKAGNWGYQGGLRVESSDYSGKINDATGKTYKIQYPVIPFPSGFVTYNFNDNNNLQLSYTRRISRPNFFQLIPYTDYSDSLNLRRGNPNLKPQFTDAVEFNYQHIFNRFNSFIASTYLKHTAGIITSYQLLEYNAQLKRNVVISTYENANYAYNYGLELTSKNGLGPVIDLTSNVNFYNSYINGSNLQNGLTNSRFSWFAKSNLNVKLPKGFSVQLSGDYNSKTASPVGGGGGMGGFGGGPTSTVQGYIKPRYGMDVAVRYDFLKNRMASLTFNVSDVFKTRTFNTYSESAYFTQYNLRYRDQQFWRIVFSYRFGKSDVSLFKRKNNKGPEMDDSAM